VYEKFYQFSAEPFRLSPDHAFAYAHKGYNKARAYLTYAFLRAEGFVMITGRPGTGKTTLIGSLISELAGEAVSIANLVCTQLQADALLKLVAYDFGISTTVVEKGDLLQQLTQQLKRWHRDGRRALLIVDEAQDLSVGAMEELRLLTNIQIDARPLLQIFLLGQPELRELILDPRMEQVHQRIIAATHLKALASDETEAYIRHRLGVARWRGDPVFSKAIYPLIFRFSEGIPRRINLICSRLLLHCAVEQRHQVRVADLQTVIEELLDENLASDNCFTESDFLIDDIFDDAPDQDESPFPHGHIHLAENLQQRAESAPELRLIASGDQPDNNLRPDRSGQDLNTSTFSPEVRLGPTWHRTSPIPTKPIPIVATSSPVVPDTSIPSGSGTAEPTRPDGLQEIRAPDSVSTPLQMPAARKPQGSARATKQPDTSPSTWPVMTALLALSLLIAWAINYFNVGLLVQ